MPSSWSNSAFMAGQNCISHRWTADMTEFRRPRYPSETVHFWSKNIVRGTVANFLSNPMILIQKILRSTATGSTMYPWNNSKWENIRIQYTHNSIHDDNDGSWLLRDLEFHPDRSQLRLLPPIPPDVGMSELIMARREKRDGGSWIRCQTV